MAREHCRQHRTAPATWRCTPCRMNLCSECVPGARENYDGETPRCVLCTKELVYLGGANVAPPFWRRPGLFFGYPLQPSALTTLALMTAVSAALPANLLGVAGLVLLAAVTVHYGLRIIDGVSEGNMAPPPFADAFRFDGEHLFLKQIAVLLLLGLFVAGAGYLDRALGGLALLFVLLALPASTMLLAMTRSVVESVHPRNLLLLMLRTGPTYLLLWIALLAVAAVPGLVMPLLVELLPQRALFPAAMFVSSYVTFMTYAMMGYILYEKQAQLGFAGERDFGEALEYKTFVLRRALADARILAGAGRTEQALEVLRRAVGVDESNAQLRETYYQVVSTTGDEEAIRRNANSICDFHVARGAMAKAAHYCQETRKRYPDFVPAESVTCHRVAEQLFEQGQPKQALALLLQLQRKAPNYLDIVAALILTARVLFEGLQEKDKAVALLQQVRAQHPGHAELPRIERLLQVMNASTTA